SIWRGGAKGLIAIGFLLVIPLAVTTVADRPLNGGVGNRIYHPANISELRHNYRLGIGDLTVDLRDVDIAEGTRQVNASVGLGQVTVIVPHDANVTITGKAGVGEVILLGQRETGGSVEQIVSTDNVTSPQSRGRLRSHVRSG